MRNPAEVRLLQGSILNNVGFGWQYGTVCVSMAFIDSVTIYAASGKGGNGVVRWDREKGRPRGGPAGGNGGRGGDVIVVGVRNLSALATYRYTKEYVAENGQGGSVRNRSGAGGAAVVLKVPVGTLVRVPSLGKEVEILNENEQHILLSGGVGGFGNAHFKSSINQNPMEATKGKPGEEGDVEFELKLIADAGLIGLPNAGKSSLLNALTKAKSKIGAYPFTTLEPNLGAFYGYVLADIPGLIEGASSGKGLGTRFLKHIERTKTLVHLVSAEQDDPISAYKEIRKELQTFGSGLTDKQEIILISKADTLEEPVLRKLQDALSKETGRTVLSVSIIDEQLLKAFSDQLTKFLASPQKHTTK